MGGTLFRYIIKEQIPPLILCFFGLSLILVVGRLLQLVRNSLLLSVITLKDLAQISIWLLPSLIMYVLPVAGMMAALLAFLRLSADNEWTAIRCAGIRFYQLLPPVLCIALTVTTLSFISNIVILPKANGSIRNKLHQMGKDMTPNLLQEGVFAEFDGFLFYFDAVDRDKLAARGVFIHKTGPADTEITVLAEGIRFLTSDYTEKPVLKLSNGSITFTTPNEGDSRYVRFETYYWPIMAVRESPRLKRKDELTLSELRDRYLRTGDNDAELERHLRLVLALGGLLLPLVAAPLGALFKSERRSAGLILAILIFTAYNTLLAIGKAMAEAEMVPIAVGMWTPSAAILGLCGWLWTKVDRQRPR